MSTPAPACPDPAQEARLRAYLALGIDLSAGPPTSLPPAQQEGFFALLDYYTLFAQAQALVGKVDIATGTQRQALSQQFDHVKSLLDVALKNVNDLGYGPGRASLDYLTMDYLEPPSTWAPPAPWPNYY